MLIGSPEPLPFEPDEWQLDRDLFPRDEFLRP